MKPLPYVISKKAIADLEEIWQFSADMWSVEQADRYYNLIFDEINYICKNPGSGKILEHVRKDYRASKVKSHLICYRVREQKIEIIRILHERMDTDSKFGG